MQASLALALAVAALAACPLSADASRAKVSPLSKVIDLMDGLAAKVTKEGEAEAKAYKEFFAWCDEASRNKKFEIKSATARKAKLEAAVAKSSADAEAAGVKIDELAASSAASAAELKNATAIRASEAADFSASEAELVETIDTLSRALSVLEREMAKNPAAFAQTSGEGLEALTASLGALVDAAAFSSADRRKLTALVQAHEAAGAEEEDTGAPAVAAYKTHSTGIADVLEDLKEKAEEELSSLRKAEVNSKHNYAMLKQSLEDSMTADGKDLADEKAAKASAEEAKATATGDLSATVKELAEAESALKTANENCMQTAADHEATVKSREEELQAIAEAKKILEESTGGAAKQAYSMLQAAASSRLRTRADLAGAEVLGAVKSLARAHHSEALAQLASRIAAVMKLGSLGGEDPFAKVKGLIQDLISKLESEASSEATEKAYCDEQMVKTEAKRDELTDDAAKLTAKIDQAAARSAALKAEVKELQDELAALARQQAEMDQLRQETHADYTVAKADLEAGLAGVRRAVGVLRDYYGSAEAELLQSAAVAARQPAMPAMHTKATGAGSSIIGILEVVESDFAKSLAKEEAQEEDAQEEYEKTSHANELEKTSKTQDVTYKTKEFNGLDKSIADLTSDRETVNEELGAVLEYYAKIKERCIAKPETYEQRKARREAEINGLKEALRVLEDETAFVQRKQTGLARHFRGAMQL